MRDPYAVRIDWIDTHDGKQSAQVLPWSWWKTRYGCGPWSWIRWCLGDVEMSVVRAFWHEQMVERGEPHVYLGVYYAA